MDWASFSFGFLAGTLYAVAVLLFAFRRYQ